MGPHPKQSRLPPPDCIPLESRLLLAVSPEEYATIRENYVDFGLPADMSQVNVIEIAASQLSVTSLKDAVVAAGTTTSPDLVVLRTTETQNRITYAGSADRIAIDIPNTMGAISVVSLGSRKLTLDAATKCPVMSVGGNGSTVVVNLGGLAVFWGRGGGIRQTNGTLRLQNAEVQLSQTGTVDGVLTGGGISQTYGYLSLRDVTISSNSGTLGGGLSQDHGISTLTNVTVTENGATRGGGIYVTSGTVSASNTVIRYNSAMLQGGGIYATGSSLTFTGATITLNHTDYDAGAIYQDSGTFSLRNVNISGNSTLINGGGILMAGGTLTLANALVSGNTAETGGAVRHSGGYLEFVNSTVAGNTAQMTGGGISLSTGDVTLRNSIVAKNNASSGLDLHASGGTFSGASNLVGVGGGYFQNGVDGNLTGTLASPADPLFASMAGANWAAWDLRLTSLSPAVDAGNVAWIPSGVTTDLLGQPRVWGATVDMGAYELNPRPAVVSLSINEGAAQRSMVVKVTVVFNKPVTVLAGGLDVQRSNGTPIPGVTVTPANPLGDQITWELTFDGTLPDGMYRFIAVAAAVRDLADQPLMADYTSRFHRLFGDSDGDRDVDTSDLAQFKIAMNRPANYGAYWYFDYDGDSKVDRSDYLELKNRLTRAVLR